ncbi:TetR/AcrR family transcriptional regulator [Mammaliicoccus sciuri]
MAKVAGVSKAGLYTYFKDKEDMFEKTIFILNNKC